MADEIKPMIVTHLDAVNTVNEQKLEIATLRAALAESQRKNERLEAQRENLETIILDGGKLEVESVGVQQWKARAETAELERIVEGVRGILKRSEKRVYQQMDEHDRRDLCALLAGERGNE